jgi:hypothetical protein
MNDKPNNLTWWNERTDVDAFYQAMDLFLFTSRGTSNDKETMPLVIREAVSHQIPILIYNLPVYLNYWDDYNVNYLDFNNLSNNIEYIKLALKPKIEKEAVVISTYPMLESISNITKECIKYIQSTGRKVILTSHMPVSKELQELSDYYIYDKNNILTKHTFYGYTWFDYGSWKVDLLLTGEDNDIYHGPSVYTNYYNAASLAKDLGIEKLYFLNYDYYLTNPKFLDSISEILDYKKAYVGLKKEQEGNTVITYFLASSPKFYLEHFPLISTSEEYDNLMIKWNSESNGLENLTYHTFSQNKDQVHWENQPNFTKLIGENFEHKDYSRVEYFSVIQVKDYPEQFAVFLNISNSVDSRDIKITVHEDNEILFDELVEVTHKIAWFIQVQFNANKTYTVHYNAYDKHNQTLIKTKKIVVDTQYIKYQLPKNGLLTLQ